MRFHQSSSVRSLCQSPQDYHSRFKGLGHFSCARRRNMEMKRPEWAQGTRHIQASHAKAAQGLPEPSRRQRSSPHMLWCLPLTPYSSKSSSSCCRSARHRKRQGCQCWSLFEPRRCHSTTGAFVELASTVHLVDGKLIQDTHQGTQNLDFIASECPFLVFPDKSVAS